MTVWHYGGSGEIYEGLGWDNRPSMAGSGASEDLQRAWVSVVQSIQDITGALRPGSCFLLNLSAAPLVQQILGEPVARCAGYAAFCGHRGVFEAGFRWAPDKWAKWVDLHAGDHLRPLQDVHTWLETETHYVDFSTGDAMGDPNPWPPLLYWRKADLPRHPRDVAGKHTVLTWRSEHALDMVGGEIGELSALISMRAMQRYSTRDK